MVPVCDPIIPEVEAGKSYIQGSLGYIAKPFSKQNNQYMYSIFQKH